MAKPQPHQTPHGPVLILAVRHRPFEIATLVAVLFSTIVSLVNGPNQTQQAMNALVPGYTWIWTIGVTLGAGLALGSIPLRTPTCLLLERTGLWLLAAMFFAYAAISFIGFGLIAFSGSVLLLGFGIAAVLRIGQLTNDIRTLKGLPRQLTEMRGPVPDDEPHR